MTATPALPLPEDNATIVGQMNVSLIASGLGSDDPAIIATMAGYDSAIPGMTRSDSAVFGEITGLYGRYDSV